LIGQVLGEDIFRILCHSPIHGLLLLLLLLLLLVCQLLLELVVVMHATRLD
jgi:hypothetical protein